MQNEFRLKPSIVIFIILLSCVLVLLLVYFAFCKSNDRAEIIVGSQIFKVEIADTDKERVQGLKNRESLERGAGMLFVYDEPVILSFWMKDTKIPLDVIWISEDLEIVDIKTLSPCEIDKCPVFSVNENAKYVLEINAGEFMGKIGHKVEIMNYK